MDLSQDMRDKIQDMFCPAPNGSKQLEEKVEEQVADEKRLDEEAESIKERFEKKPDTNKLTTMLDFLIR